MVEVRGCKSQMRSKHIVFAGSPLVAITDTKELLRVFPIRSESDGEWYVREFINLERPPYGYVADPALDFFQEPIERRADAATTPTRLSFGIWAEHTPHCGCNHDSLSLHLRVFPDGLIRVEGQKVVKSNPNDVCVD